MNDIRAMLTGGLTAAGLAELFYHQARNLTIKAFKGAIASVAQSDNRWVGARVVAEQRLGSAFTERLDADAIARTLARAETNRRFADADPGNVLNDDDETGDYDGRQSSLESVGMDRKKAMTLDAEKAALEADPRIVNVQHCYYWEDESSVAIATGRGLWKSQRNASSGCFVAVMARQGEETQTGSEFAVATGPVELDIRGAVHTAVKGALDKLGAVEIPSGEYTVVFDRRAASQLLGAFVASPASPFYGENIQKGRSMLAGKLGAKIGSDLFTIADDPSMGVSPTFFDGEGVAARKLTLVDHGTFANVVHNLYSAAREPGAQTTGHASRSRGGVGTGMHHPYLQNGSGTLDELLVQMNQGILITEVTGLHAGLNPITGDFSLSAQGFRIAGGVRAEPVRNMVVAGTFLDLGHRLCAKAEDRRVDSTGGLDSPSVMIDRLSVSGT